MRSEFISLKTVNKSSILICVFNSCDLVLKFPGNQVVLVFQNGSRTPEDSIPAEECRKASQDEETDRARAQRPKEGCGLCPQDQLCSVQGNQSEPKIASTPFIKCFFNLELSLLLLFFLAPLSFLDGVCNLGEIIGKT